MADGGDRTLKGKRRVNTDDAASFYDGVSHTFPQYLQFFQGNKDWALRIWNVSIDVETEDTDAKASMRKKLKVDLEKQAAMDFCDLARGGVNLLLQSADAGEAGNSLRMNEAGDADLLGGAGCKATLTVIPVFSLGGKAEGPQQVRFRTAEGAYLRFDKAAGLTFRGFEDEEETVFGVEPADPWPHVLVKHQDGFSARFFPRWGCDPRGPSWWHRDMLNKARAMVAADPEFRGRRFHPQDKKRQLFTFVQWVEFADREWLTGVCPVGNAAVQLAAEVWKDQCAPEAGGAA